MTEREYGRLARVGVALPPANTTVEPEIAMLMPPGVSIHTTRMVSHADSVPNRLTDYIEHLDDAVDSYFHAQLDALMFACTGSSYLVGRERERDLIKRASDKHGLPIISTAGSIIQALESIGAQRICLIAPYPTWLTDAAEAYWRDGGLDVLDREQIAIEEDRARLGPSLRGIYALRTEAVEAALQRLSQRVDWASVDAVLLTGVGMPTLPAIARLSGTVPPPMVSSMLCLAWAALGVLGLTDRARTPDENRPAGRLLSTWLDRLDQEYA